MQCRHYTILHPYIDKSIRQYRTMSHTILRMLTWGGVRGGSHWPCSWSAHRSCLMILGPPGWSVLHRHSPDSWRPFPRSGILHCNQCEWWPPCTSKKGICPGAWAAIIAPRAHKVIECDRLRHGSDGRVWQVMFLCKLTERQSEEEQCGTEW